MQIKKSSHTIFYCVKLGKIDIGPVLLGAGSVLDISGSRIAFGVSGKRSNDFAALQSDWANVAKDIRKSYEVTIRKHEIQRKSMNLPNAKQMTSNPEYFAHNDTSETPNSVNQAQHHFSEDPV